MTCKSCVAKVKSQLLSTAGVEIADVQLQSPQATITMQNHIALAALQAALHKSGHYTIHEADGGMKKADTVSWLYTYKPVLLVFAFIAGVALLIQLGNRSFIILTWMQYFMTGFFLVFSFFKLLDIKAFANGYAMYDIIAKKWNGWGYIYPFAELALGIAWLVFPGAVLTGILTLAIMGVSIIGVAQTIMAKRQIQCACLGAVFKLPMSTITVIEDGLMIGMSLIMLVTMI